jgi:O-antigen/teichoic acid export membrane protein/O-antigen ligase
MARGSPSLRAITPEGPDVTKLEDPLGDVSRRTLGNVVFAAIGSSVGKIGTLAFALIGARALSKGDFGAFSYAVAVGALLAALPGWGFDRVLIRDASVRPERLNIYLAEIYTWRALVATPVFAAAVAVELLVERDTEVIVAFVAIVAALLLDMVFDQSAMAAAAARQRLGGVAAAQTFQRIATALLAVAAVIGGFGLVGFSVALLAGNLVGTAGTLLALRAIGVQGDFAAMTRRGFAAFGRGSFVLGLDSILAMALWRLDAVILEALKGDAAVASYSVAYRMLETALFVTFSVTAAIYPVMSAPAGDQIGRVKAAIERGMSVVAIAYVPYGLALVTRSEGIVEILFGAKYRVSAAGPLAWLAIAPIAVAFGYIATSALVSQHHVRGTILASLAATIFNVSLNFALIPTLGANGAGIATFAAYAFESAILFVLVSKRFGVPRLDRAMRESVLAGVVMAGVLAVVHIDTVVDIGLASIAFGVSWLVLTARFAPERLELVRSFLRRGGGTPDPDGSLVAPPLVPQAAVFIAEAPIRQRSRFLEVAPRRTIGALGIVGLVAASLAAGVGLAIVGVRFGPVPVVLIPAAALWFGAALGRRVWAVVPVFLGLPIALSTTEIGSLQSIDVIVVAIIIVTTLASLAVRRRAHQPFPTPLLWAIGLCGLAALSVPSALDVTAATRQLLSLTVAVLLSFCVVAACERLADVRLLVGAFLGVGGFLCSLSYGSASGLRASFGGGVVESRATGLLVDPNELGLLAAMVLMIALAVAMSEFRPAARVAAAVVGVLATGALILSLSRGAWIGTGFGLVALLVLMPRARRGLLVVAVVATALGLSFGALRSETPEVSVVRARFGALLHPSENPYDDRGAIWSEAVREIKLRPFLGYGPANFPVASERSSSDFELGAAHAHDALLTVGAEMGLPAVAVVIAFTIAVGLAIRRAAKSLRRRPDSAIAAGVGAALFALVGHCLLDFPIRNPVLMITAWALVGLALAIDRLGRAETVSPR